MAACDALFLAVYPYDAHSMLPARFSRVLILLAALAALAVADTPPLPAFVVLECFPSEVLDV